MIGTKLKDLHELFPPDEKDELTLFEQEIKRASTFSKERFPSFWRTPDSIVFLDDAVVITRENTKYLAGRLEWEAQMDVYEALVNYISLLERLNLSLVKRIRQLASNPVERRVIATAINVNSSTDDGVSDGKAEAEIEPVIQNNITEPAEKKVPRLIKALTAPCKKCGLIVHAGTPKTLKKRMAEHSWTHRREAMKNEGKESVGGEAGESIDKSGSEVPAGDGGARPAAGEEPPVD